MSDNDLMLKFEGFKSANRPSTGLALVFDIAGFTNFFTKPDLQSYITRYLNRVIECVEICIYGGFAYWINDDGLKDFEPLETLPDLKKFLGDGMLYVWENIDERLIDELAFKFDLINGLWDLQKNFGNVNRRLLDELPLAALPSKIKFGLAQGSIYRLSNSSGATDFIGPCINLATRLVKYCPDVNFLCSARLELSLEELNKNNYMRIIAKELKSFELDIVVIDKNDYKNVNEEDRERLFIEI